MIIDIQSIIIGVLGTVLCGIIGFVFWLLNDNRYKYIATFRDITNGKSIVYENQKGRKIFTKRLGEVIFYPKMKAITPNFDSIYYETSAVLKGRKHIDLTLKDGFYHVNVLKKIKRMTAEEQVKERERFLKIYGIDLFDNIEHINNPLTTGAREFYFGAIEETNAKTEPGIEWGKVLLAFGLAAMFLVFGGVGGYMAYKSQVEAAQKQVTEMFAAAPQCTAMIQSTKADIIQGITNVIKGGQAPDAQK